jgi:hypothetical protein
MRNIVFKDKTISQTAYNQLISDYTGFIKDTTGIKVETTTIDYNFTDYPTVLDSDGDDRPTDKFLNEFKDIVQLRYGKHGQDNIILLIHQDNWKSGKTDTRRGIWGTNYSYKYGNYHVQYCRFDKRNAANSFGTLNHEIDHSLDALIKTEIGVDINPILGVVHYDRNTTHGQPEAYHAYIRHQENADKLKVMAPYLKAAYAKRLERHQAELTAKKKTIINLLEQVVYLYRQVLNKKNGNPK